MKLFYLNITTSKSFSGTCTRVSGASVVPTLQPKPPVLALCNSGGQIQTCTRQYTMSHTTNYVESGWYGIEKMFSGFSLYDLLMDRKLCFVGKITANSS